MALNVETFKTRTITAIVFAIAMLAGLLLHGWGFVALCTIIMLGCIYEFIKLAKKISPKNYAAYLLLALVYIVLPMLALVTLGFTSISTTAIGETFAVPSFLYSALLPCAVIFSIWTNDTMAYIVGSFIGKTPFSKISPKKTWEGTIGGALLCIIVIGLLGYFLPVAKHIPIVHWLAIAAICAVFGTLGDLFESKLKRLAGVKDSGSFMPGHGGFLDRFDSLLFAAPMVWLYLKMVL